METTEPASNAATAEPQLEKLLTVAADYQRRGWKTLPLTNGKAPIGVRNWPTREFSSHDFRRTWNSSGVKKALADRNEQYAPGIGVQIGRVSNIIDAEWDNESQRRKLIELCGGKMPGGPEFKSRKGGHKPFGWDNRLRTISSATIDFQCDDGSLLKIRIGGGDKGAQSAFPPSLNKVWLPGKSPDDLLIPATPEPLIEQLLAAEAGKKKSQSTGGDWSDHRFSDDQIESCRHALAELPPPVSGDNGQSKFMVACSLIRRCVGNYEQALDLATWFNDTKCEPPFDSTEVERKLNESDASPRSHPFDDFEPVPPWEGSMWNGESFPYKFYSSAELDGADFKVEFLIDGVMVAGQPLFIAGPRMFRLGGEPKPVEHSWRDDPSVRIDIGSKSKDADRLSAKPLVSHAGEQL